MQLLPSELKCIIVELCSDSPYSLAALARTHSAYQRDAEMALYDTIFIDPTITSSLKCMETLAKNPEKAAFVRSLIVEFGYDTPTELEWRVENYLLKSLVNMDSLSDLRVRWHISYLDGKMTDGLGKILWSVCVKF